jgi:hypothetical protein
MSAASLLAGGLLIGASALAATPKKGARFAGVLSTPPVAGFHAPVTFRVSPNGKLLENFTYGSFGCFGAGGFAPGKNPYTSHSLVNVGAIKVAANGHFSQTKAAGYTVSGQTTTYSVIVSGRFTKHTSATGTIVFTETVSGLPSKCTSPTLAFTATG